MYFVVIFKGDNAKTYWAQSVKQCFIYTNDYTSVFYLALYFKGLVYPK